MRDPDRVEQLGERILLSACTILGLAIAVSAVTALPNYVPLLGFGAALGATCALLAAANRPRGRGLPALSFFASITCLVIVEFTFPRLRVLPAAISILFLLVTLLGGVLAALPLVRRDLRRGVALIVVIALQWRLYDHVPSETGVVVIAIALVTTLLAALCNVLFRLHRQQYRAEIVNRKLARATAELLDMRQRHSLSILSAGIAHEINNPINYLLGNLDYLRRYYDALYDAIPAPGPETVAMHEDGLNILSAFDEGLQAVRGVVSRLRSLFRGESEGKHIADISAVISSVISSQKSRLEPKAQISVTIDSSVTEVSFHPADLYVVVSNLIRNAEESVDSEDEPACIVVAAIRDKNGTVALTIEDDGIGIPQEFIEQVFDPFFTTKTDRGGLGVGLTLCAALAEKNGAVLQMNHREPRGTRVTVTFTETDSFTD